MWFLQGMLYILGVFLAFLIVTMVVTIIWVRSSTKGRIVAFFIEHNREVQRKLINLKGRDWFTTGKGDKELHYTIVSGRQCWSYWPAYLPRSLQERVPSYWYVRGKGDPIHPEDIPKSRISDRDLQILLDRAVMEDTWRDARESVGLGRVKVEILRNPAFWAALAACIIALGCLWICYTTSSDVSKLLRLWGM